MILIFSRLQIYYPHIQNLLKLTPDDIYTRRTPVHIVTFKKTATLNSIFPGKQMPRTKRTKKLNINFSLTMRVQQNVFP